MLKRIIAFALFAGLTVVCPVYAQQDYPERIISLGPALTEDLYLLGADNLLVGCTVYCNKPKEAQKKEKVGTVVEVNLEKILSLKPDLVLATPLTKPEAKEKLKSLGIKVIEFPQPKNFEDICGQLLKLGSIVGKEAQAQEITDNARKKTRAIKERVASLPKPKVFVQVGARPLMTVTKDYFINDFIEMASGINIARDAKGIRYSREKVLQDNPDVILITTMGISAEEEQRIWQGYKTLKAARENRIYIIDSDMFCSPTPISFAAILEELTAILHPAEVKR